MRRLCAWVRWMCPSRTHRSWKKPSFRPRPTCLLPSNASRRSSVRLLTVLAALLIASTVATLLAWSPTTLESIDAMPAHIAGTFEDALAYQRLPDGTIYVFDRRGH